MCCLTDCPINCNCNLQHDALITFLTQQLCEEFVALVSEFRSEHDGRIKFLRRPTNQENL